MTDQLAARERSPRNTSLGCGALGGNPLAHMAFLVQAPQRVLALRLALSRVVGPQSIVLDAGCGALGLLAIIAARLGAARAVGVDVGNLDLARALAAENGVDDRVDFVEGDLASVQLDTPRFDVVVAMIYHNDPRLDRRQHELMDGLLRRYGHASTVCVPNKVRYTLAGYDNPSLEPKAAQRRAEWRSRIRDVAHQAGMSFGAVEALLDGENPPPLGEGPPRARWDLQGYLDHSESRLLTRAAVLSEIDIRPGAAFAGYPDEVALDVIASGRLNQIVARQELMFDDILIRATESSSLAQRPGSVEPGDRVVASTGARWAASIPLRVEERGRTAANQ